MVLARFGVVGEEALIAANRPNPNPHGSDVDDGHDFENAFGAEVLLQRWRTPLPYDVSEH